MKKYSKRILAVNTFGTLGYMSCVLLWGWIGLLYLPMFLENEIVSEVLLPTPKEEMVTRPVAFETSPLMMLFAAIVTIVMVVATLVILIRIPIAVAKTGKVVTTKAATSTMPLVTKGRPLPPAQKKRLTTTLIKLIKLLLVVIPMVATLIGALADLPVPYEVTVFVSSSLSLCTLLWFSAQYIFARILAVDSKLLV